MICQLIASPSPAPWGRGCLCLPFSRSPPSSNLTLAPGLFPIATRLGIDPVHLSIILIVSGEIGVAPVTLWLLYRLF